MSGPSTRATGAPSAALTFKARLLRTDRRLLSLALLLPVLVVVWMPLLRGKPAPRPAETTVAVPSQDEPVGIAAAPMAESNLPLALPAGSPAAVSRLGSMVAAALTPFEPRWREPRKSATTTNQAPEPPKPPSDRAAAAPPVELVPSAILLSPGARAMAIVGGAPRAVGDTVGTHTLIAIEERSVRYRRGAESITVNLPPPVPRGSQ